MAQYMNNNSRTNEHMIIGQTQVNQDEIFSARSDLAMDIYIYSLFSQP